MSSGSKVHHLVRNKPKRNENSQTAYHAAFKVMFLPPFFSQDPLGLRSHITLGSSSLSQGVSCFPGESGASGRERGPLAPVGWT